ncbi:hypothetical protein, partial [Caballeronia sp.]|uniref:hypothetical protein n=1 Tax=Caballeronia sp. TaxID=1931223 RepID=UPI002606B8A2
MKNLREGAAPGGADCLNIAARHSPCGAPKSGDDLPQAIRGRSKVVAEPPFNRYQANDRVGPGAELRYRTKPGQLQAFDTARQIAENR